MPFSVTDDKHIHQLIQTLPLEKRKEPWKVGDGCLLRITDNRITEIAIGVYRGVITKKKLSTLFEVRLIDIGIEIPKNIMDIYENVDIELMERKSRTLKLGFEEYNQLDEKKKVESFTKLTKFRNNAAGNTIEAKIDFADDENPKLLELTSFSNSKNKTTTGSFILRLSQLKTNPNPVHDRPQNFVIPFKNKIDGQHHLDSYLTVNVSDKFCCFSELCW